MIIKQPKHTFEVLVTEYPVIFVKRVDELYEDGVKIGQANPVRYQLTPNDDISNEVSEIRAVADSIFTEQAKQAYISHNSGS